MTLNTKLLAKLNRDTLLRFSKWTPPLNSKTMTITSPDFSTEDKFSLFSTKIPYLCSKMKTSIHWSNHTTSMLLNPPSLLLICPSITASNFLKETKKENQMQFNTLNPLLSELFQLSVSPTRTSKRDGLRLFLISTTALLALKNSLPWLLKNKWLSKEKDLNKMKKLLKLKLFKIKSNKTELTDNLLKKMIKKTPNWKTPLKNLKKSFKRVKLLPKEKDLNPWKDKENSKKKPKFFKDKKLPLKNSLWPKLKKKKPKLNSWSNPKKLKVKRMSLKKLKNFSRRLRMKRTKNC